MPFGITLFDSLTKTPIKNGSTLTAIANSTVDMVKELGKSGYYADDLIAQNIVLVGQKAFLIDIEKDEIKQNKSWSPRRRQQNVARMWNDFIYVLQGSLTRTMTEPYATRVVYIFQECFKLKNTVMV